MTATPPLPDLLPSSANSGPALFLALQPAEAERADGIRQRHIARGDAVSTVLMGPHSGSGPLTNSEANIQRVVDAIAQCGAQVVYTPGRGEQSADYRMLASIASEAVRRIQGRCDVVEYALEAEKPFVQGIAARLRDVGEALRGQHNSGQKRQESSAPAKRSLMRILRAVYVALPLSVHVKRGLATRLLNLFMKLRSVQRWRPWARGTAQKFVRTLYGTGRLEWDRSDYVPYTDQGLDPADLTLRCIAYYLPQFHPIPENDRWWGNGFTEWTNVTRALPQFIGHYQPKLPGDLGFYDLRVVDTMRKQAELARHYGVAGFCMYYYWFDGKRLLDQPQRQVLDHPDLDFPFCLCWANENWTRRWDGQDADMLIAQRYSPEDDLAIIADLVPSFLDPRYIRIDGKPVFLVYRPMHLPQLRDTVQRWRTHCRENGVGELYLVAVESFERLEPNEYGFDAACEFPPHQASLPPVNHEVEFINRRFEGRVYDYTQMADFFTSRPESQHVRFSGIATAWDNEARKPGKGNIFINSSAQNYANWLESSAARTATVNSGDERVMFVNAWNEWAEGTYLEPDRRFGYAYLHATSSVLRQFRKKDPAIESVFALSRSTFTKKASTAIVVHLFYRDLLEELCVLIGNVADPMDVFITVADDAPLEWVEVLRAKLPNAYLLAAPNRGRDILPFFLMLPVLQQFGYATVCKLHSKKSPHREDGQDWRSLLWQGLFSPQAVALAYKAFESDKALGLLAPVNALTDLSQLNIYVNNRPWLDHLLRHVAPRRRKGNYRLHFPAGSMFWFRPGAMPTLSEFGIKATDFEAELGQVDGTLAHALERLFAFGVKSRGYKVNEMSPAETGR
jgi:lipopolysaccharide biosynthesis protein